MLGKRRPPPHIVFYFSLLLGVLALIPAYRYAMAENWLPTALWGAVAIWLMVDAIRSYGWMKNAQTQAEQAPPVPQSERGEFTAQEAPAFRPAQPAPDQSGLRPNPLLGDQGTVPPEGTPTEANVSSGPTPRR
ncbi:hypothetical protein [Deinococcus radiophilus]|uniref:hypothetical protein n=1 Tax=Deinococcus radiophilus TaxID=32062 RepID=UPI001B874B7A|nr:hypothetical protein [Deinococcus radiophilus]UFA50568.1 hypothetical protein LMT64_01225 [Deinococcus radiophilus]